MTTILLSAVEPSADQIGASLVTALRERRGDLRLVGVGGPATRAAGLAGAFDPSALSVVGLTDALRAVPAALAGAGRLARLAAAERPEVAVLIDGWGFHRLAATRLRAAAPGTRLVKLAAPQVWASRPERARVLAERFDLTLTLLPFEAPLLEAAGARARFVGNPNFQAAADAPAGGEAFRARHGLGEAPVLVVLPGSRRAEASRLMGVFRDAAGLAVASVPRLRAVLCAAPAVEDAVREAAGGWPAPPLVVPAAERFAAFDAAAASGVALVASGTATTELAIRGVPMTVGYRVDRLSAAWIRRVAVTDLITVLNVAAGEAVVPERLQETCTPDALSADLIRLLTDDAVRRGQLAAFERLVPALLGDGDPSGAAADAVLDLIGEGEDPVDLDARAQG